MKLTFHGAAQEVTGSAHVLTVNGKNVLLDCGLYQGKRKEAFEKNRKFPYDPATLDAVILSHAHMDHSGNLPTLVKKGYRGKIWCTDATADLCQIMFRDCAHIQELDVEYVNKKRAKQGQNLFEPLYTLADADEAAKHLSPVQYSQAFSPVEGLEVSFHDAGHIIGSAFTAIDARENGTRARIMFTGDIGRKDIPILQDPVPVRDIDYLITESTYGDRLHPPAQDVEAKMATLVNTICRTKGKIVIPSFSIGRTQHLVYVLNKLHSEGRIGSVPVYVDSPLSSAATDVYSKHEECWDQDAKHFLLNEGRPFSFQGLHYTESIEESKRLNDMSGPMIIISASGMAEAGRILHHLKNTISFPQNVILIVGYMAENTLGRRIADKARTVKIFGDEYPRKAQVEVIGALSAHADKNEMIDYFEKCGPESIKHAFCVHGDPEVFPVFEAALKGIGMQSLSAPKPGDSFELGD
jgi:metallo-beta-lactamase family protein